MSFYIALQCRLLETGFLFSPDEAISLFRALWTEKDKRVAVLRGVMEGVVSATENNESKGF